SRVSSLAILAHLTRIKEHAASLLGDGFTSRTGLDHLADLPRYLAADTLRLDKPPERPRRDQQLPWQLDAARQHCAQARARLPPRRRAQADAREIDWMIEELRVSLFAQTLGTRYTVSDKRIRRAIAEL